MPDPTIVFLPGDGHSPAARRLLDDRKTGVRRAHARNTHTRRQRAAAHDRLAETATRLHAALGAHEPPEVVRSLEYELTRARTAYHVTRDAERLSTAALVDVPQGRAPGSGSAARERVLP